MRKWIFYNIAFLLIVSSSGYSGTNSSDSSNKKAGAESSLGINLNISDLGNGTVRSLGTFDGDVGFDPFILSFNGAAYGKRHDLFGFVFENNTISPETGSVDYFALSFNGESDINQVQPDDPPLSPLTFVPPAIGRLAVGVSALGNTDGSVAVSPLPPTMILFGIGLIGFIGLRKKFRKFKFDWKIN